MKFKPAVLALAATLLSGAAMATTVEPTFVSATGGSFTDAVIGTFTLDQTSNVTGSVIAATSVSWNGLTLPLQSVSFSFAGISGKTDLDTSANGFSYANLAAGTYQLLASGTLSGVGALNGAAIVGAQFSTTLVATPAPEPATYALMLAGIGALGFLARRRNGAGNQ